ncbi:DUF192 domain-containing protein [Cohnella sp. CFH 77786]|uniref:DUF192 domain-containing protein n=1 Tax=Cohnella sp. CFH 77786 TaxID=2662265 RepID=UPI001C60E784|nr:DUF192 domain-containing protein [Cohnella sp. CFH 77786]MBW5447511.1 DUF192 domain-containing protein [Cohnella sp. CFH 77786]
MKLTVRESGRQLASQMSEARSFWKRLRGLMLTESLPEGCGLHIRTCKSVHSFLMNYPIDVLHLDENGQITGIEHRLGTGTIGKAFPGTRSVVELPAGTLAREEVKVGQTVIFQPAQNQSERV